jgi:hypothetical protein
MSGMTATDRNQLERVDLSVPSTGLRLKTGRGLATYFVVSTALLVALGYWAVKEIDGWASLIVLGMIIVNVVGLMIAVRPNRRTPWG